MPNHASPDPSNQAPSLKLVTNSDGPMALGCYRLMEGRLFDLIHDYDIGVGGPMPNGIRSPAWSGLGDLHPFDTVAWETGPVSVTNEAGATIFTEPAAEFPATWSEHARSIVASKYFYGDHGQGFRETSLKQLLFRVSTEIAIVAIENDTFYDKIDCINFYYYLLMMQLHQYFAFNSPVYFNVGTWIYSGKVAAENFYWDRDQSAVAPCPDVGRHPQVSACFIQSVEDNMQSIMDLATSEAMLFKRGSGTGTDLSPLRSCKERLSGGGKPSGPLSFMKVYDAVASVVKSGGKTRRAAKIQSLKTDHPDIMDFIEAKVKEERKAKAMIAQGYEANFNGEAYSSVFFQNSNLSVRASDAFMNAVENDWKFPTFARTTGQEVELLHAPTVMQAIAESAYACGDPGLQFDDTINQMNPTPEAGRINASNPCSEYMYIDDSACNLASLNLLKFRSLNTQTHDMMLDICKFNECIDVAITAMDTLVDHGSYPTAKIAAHSHALRPLGLGYANAGAYLMAAGIPYDSEDGQAFIAVVSCLLTGEAYSQSGRLAERFGTINGWLDHKDDFIGVMYKHLDTLNQECISWCDDDLVSAAAKSWNQAIEYATYHGIRNAQATCIAPTGTISFMMDCDTLGIEPEIALVRYKHLAGRGMLKLVNQTVPLALRSLGYQEGQIGEILGHIERFGTIESVGLDCGDGADVEPMDCPLKEEHLPVFDCAFAPADGIDPLTGRMFSPRWHRSIVVMGHVDMLAAATPAISGAISKTVNMPSWYTTNSIKEVYMKAWRLGCKAISIYRDGSKDSQPITTAVPAAQGGVSTDSARAMAEQIERMSKELGQLHTELENARAPYRRKMPDNRKAQVHKFSVAGHEGYIICGFYPDDGQLGEVFIEISKNGSTVGGLMGVIGTLISVSLQYGVPLVKVVEKLANHRFEPAGITGNRDIPFAKSLIDYIAHWLGCEFIDGYRATVRPRRADEQTPAEPAGPGSMENPSHWTEEYANEQSGGPVIAVNAWPDRQQDRQSFAAQIHGPSCPNCGAIMVQQGPCAVCFNCAHTEGGCGG